MTPERPRRPDALTRRDLLRQTTTGLAAAAAAPGLFALDRFTRGEHVPGLPFDSARPDAAAAAAEPMDCSATEDDIEGPYYRPGAPERATVRTDKTPGLKLVLAGQVLGPHCSPLAGALLDFWQADDAGRYDNDDPDHPPASDLFTLRGRQRTNATGRWALRTIYPGNYRIGPKQWRPAHIHVKVSAKGAAHLTTQLYFAGDPHFEGDPFWHPSLVITLGGDPELKGGKAGRFDFYLMKG